MTRAIAEQSRTIRLPVHLSELLNKVKKSAKAMTLELGREPTDVELSIRLDLPVAKLQLIKRASQSMISLEQPVHRSLDGRADGRPVKVLWDTVSQPEEGDRPEEQLAERMLLEDLDKALAMLRTREREVLELRYGLADGRPRTRSEISKCFNVTRERIRQIEVKALLKLRDPERLYEEAWYV